MVEKNKDRNTTDETNNGAGEPRGFGRLFGGHRSARRTARRVSVASPGRDSEPATGRPGTRQAEAAPDDGETRQAAVEGEDSVARSGAGVGRARGDAAAEGGRAAADVPGGPQTNDPTADGMQAGAASASDADGDVVETNDTGTNDTGGADAAQGDARGSDALLPQVTRPDGLPPATILFMAPEVLPGWHEADGDLEEPETSHRRRSRHRSGRDDRDGDRPQPGRRDTDRQTRPLITEPQKIKGSTRLEAKKQRRRDGRADSHRRQVITEVEFLARRESVDRAMVVRERQDRIQIGVLEDGVLVEHYVARSQEASLIGNVYLGRVQNVLPSMEAAFVDIGRGRNAVLYSGEVDWQAAAERLGSDKAHRIENALKPGDTVLVQVTKDPVGHKGARLTSQVSLPGRYLVYVPGGSMNGISRKLPDTERARLKKILKALLPEDAGVIVRTAAEGATDDQLTRDVDRLRGQWDAISAQVQGGQAPLLLHSEPDLLIKIVRDIFNEDFHRLVVDGDEARATIEHYLSQVAPDLVEKVERYDGDDDSFDHYRIAEQIEKALERKVWLPSGGTLIIDRTEAMTVIDVNTGKFVGSGGNLEETVTKNNLEAAEEIVRQLRLRDIGGIIVVDFIDMVLESNRDLVLRRLVECLSRDRTKHQVAEVTSLGLIQMTRKKIGLGLLETFGEPCEVCAGRGVVVHHDPVLKHKVPAQTKRKASSRQAAAKTTHALTEKAKKGLAQIAASTLSHPSGTAEDQIAENETGGARHESEQAVAILDIPIAPSRRRQRVSTSEAEHLLDSVLDALPQPKKATPPRTRRRVTTGSLHVEAAGDGSLDE
ncbi:MAG TPA: Rne/Rng family ribonuclease [Microbacteriaceae bacterium]|nr:Rne/Rng family ribonuclease [Microbacteriaceae bacterium]